MRKRILLPFVASLPGLAASAQSRQSDCLWSEDFAFYTHVMPGCFFRLGTGAPDEASPRGLHTPTFDIDERVFSIGCGMMVAGVMAELG